MDNALGLRIAEARKRARLTQRALGTAVGVSSQAVTLWEGGSSKPSRDHLIAVARETAVSVQWLLFGTLTERHENGSLSTDVGRVRAVPILSMRAAVDSDMSSAGNQTPAIANFPCSDRSFALDLLDDSNAPTIPRGARVIVDPDRASSPGSLILAACGEHRAPTIGRMRQEATLSGILTIIEPTNSAWPASRSDHGPVEIVGTVTEIIIPVQ